MMMRRCVIIVFVLVMVAACGATAAKPGTILKEGIDRATITELAQKGQLMNLIYNDEGELTHRMCAVVVNAGPDTVWDVITDYENYDKFIPDMAPPEIRERKAGGVTLVDFTLRIRIVMGVGTTQKYSTKFVPERPFLYRYDPGDPGAEPGFWELVPLEDGAKTLLFYYDTVPDLSRMGGLVSGLTSARPEFRIALQVSPMSILVSETKKYAEKIAAGN